MEELQWVCHSLFLDLTHIIYSGPNISGSNIKGIIGGTVENGSDFG